MLSLQFKLKKIDEARNYLLDEIEPNDEWNNKWKV